MTMVVNELLLLTGVPIAVYVLQIGKKYHVEVTAENLLFIIEVVAHYGLS